MVALNPSTVWGQLAGLNGAYGSIVFIDLDSTTPTIDPANFFWDAQNKILNLGFDAQPAQSRFNLNGGQGLYNEFGMVSALANNKQSALEYASFILASFRGTAQVPLVNLTGDFIGSFSSWGYTGAVGAWAELFSIDTYAIGATSSLGGAVIMQVKADGGVLTPFMSVASNLAVSLLGALSVAGNLVVSGTFSLLGLFSTAAINFVVGVSVPTNGFYSDLINRVKLTINGIVVATWTSTGLVLAQALKSASGGLGLDASGAAAGTVPTADGAGNFNMTLPPGAAVPAGRLINTTAPITGGGDLSADRTHAIAANGITNALLAQMATLTMKGNNTGGTANAADLTVAQVIALIGALTAGGANQIISGGATVTVAAIAAGNYTVAQGTRPIQYIPNTGAFTLTAPANDGICIVQVENGAGAGAITLSGFTTPAAGNGDSLDTTNGHKFRGYIETVHAISTVWWRALQ